MKNILITGMSGTGKSTVIRALVTRGYRAVDTDSDEWCVWTDDPMADGLLATTTERDWIWREERIDHLLKDRYADILFVSGCKSNQSRFYQDFDHIVLLSASTDVILDRLATRTTNDYGKSDEERLQVLWYLETVEPLLRRSSDVEIDTGATSLEDVVSVLIALAQDDAMPTPLLKTPV